jgi:NADPH:quinone reductase-like Zn-dependent oxidoreductase
MRTQLTNSFSDSASAGQVPEPAALPRASPASSSTPAADLGLQFVLGAEFAGRISAASPIPAGCTFKPGDRVFGYAQGSFGEKVATSWKSILPMPSTLSYDQAAGAGLFMAVCLVRRLTSG